jgi:putative peptidoglycan lipid II flippase
VRQQLKSASIFSFVTLISRIFGFIRDMLIAKFVGVNILSDVFFAVFKLPNFFRRIFAEGAFNNAFIPIFSGKLENNRNDAIEFAQNILSFLFFTLLILILILQILMPFFISAIFPGFKNGSSELSLAVNLSRITIFYLLFISLVSLFSAILNSFNRFAVTSASPIILNLTFIVFLLFLREKFPNLAYNLSFAVFFAGILQLIWIITFSIKEKVLIYPKLPKINQDMKLFFKKIVPGIIGANVMQMNLLIDTAIASFFAGGISYIYYADRVNQLPLAMIGIALSVTLLPTLSRKIKRKNFIEANNLHNKILFVALLVALPAAIGLCFLSENIVQILFERDRFTNYETVKVANALMIYAIALPAFILVKIFEPGFFARGDTKTPMKIAIICLIVNLVLNLILIQYFEYLGIVIASAIASYVNLLLLITKLLQKKYFYFKKIFFANFIIIATSSILMLLFLMFLQDFLLNYQILNLIKLVIIIILSAILYFMLNYIFFHLKNYIKS